MGIFNKKPNPYRENDDLLHIEQKKAMLRGDWAAYDDYARRIKENNESWAQNKSTREKFDKTGRGNIVARILGIIGVGTTIGYMAYSEKHDGVIFSGSNGEAKKSILGNVLGWVFK